MVEMPVHAKLYAVSGKVKQGKEEAAECRNSS